MKTALITGAAQGIGNAVALRFLRDGYRVVAADRSPLGLEQLLTVAPDRVATIVQDVTADSAADEAVGLAVERFGGLDVLVNNAGIAHGRPIGETTDEQFGAFLDVHLWAPFRYSRSAVGVMQAGAAIVHIASITGLRAPSGSGGYSVAKTALVGLTRQMAADLGPRGIRTNAVAPGVTRTPLMADRIDGDERFRRDMIDTIPLRRVALPEDIASAVAFLASDEASFICGHVLVVDGGWMAASVKGSAP